MELRLSLKSIYYGWWILIGAIIVQFLAISVGQMVSGVFLDPIVADLGIKVWKFSAAISVSTAMGGITLIFLGPMIDRVGPRRIMLTGALICSIGLIGISFQSKFWQFFLLQILSSAFGWTLFGPLIISPIITKWFVVKRGWALAIGSIGVSLGGIITPITMTTIVDMFNWRIGYLVLSVVVFVVIPPIALMMRRQPEDLGLLPDGIKTNKATSQKENKANEAILKDTIQTYTRSEAIKTSGFWLLSIGYGLNAAALSSIALHAIPFSTTIGFTRSLGASGLGINGLGNLISKIFWGWGLQNFDSRRLAGTAFSISSLGVLIMIAAGVTQNSAFLLCGFFLYGFGFGGTIPISEFLWARYFGRQNIASIRSLGRPVTIIFGTCGPIATGLWFDMAGSYTIAFIALATAYILGAITINISKPPIVLK
tara:strand:- start:1900 stop:3177 length:1278 start_codon:yes stop_codon:yes gene_type:complete